MVVLPSCFGGWRSKSEKREEKERKKERKKDVSQKKRNWAIKNDIQTDAYKHANMNTHMKTFSYTSFDKR